VARPIHYGRCRKKNKNKEILFFREVQAQETLFGKKKKEELGR
jgi:hypothetical protein